MRLKLTAKQRRDVVAVREFSEDYTALRRTAAVLAPHVEKAYGKWLMAADAAAGSEGFPAFVREFFPDLPKRASDYRQHNGYRAMDYLRRTARAWTIREKGLSRRRE